MGTRKKTGSGHQRPRILPDSCRFQLYTGLVTRPVLRKKSGTAFDTEWVAELVTRFKTDGFAPPSSVISNRWSVVSYEQTRDGETIKLQPRGNRADVEFNDGKGRFLLEHARWCSPQRCNRILRF